MRAYGQGHKRHDWDEHANGRWAKPRNGARKKLAKIWKKRARRSLRASVLEDQQ